MAVIIHEYAHGWVAYKLGDPTARYSGRLTLNPLAHVDPFGTIILPIMLLVMRAPFIFGWAKPVPINFSNLRNPKKDIIWVGLAGPLANVGAAIILSMLIKNQLPAALYQIITLAIIYNLILAFLRALLRLFLLTRLHKISQNLRLWIFLSCRGMSFAIIHRRSRFQSHTPTSETGEKRTESAFILQRRKLPVELSQK